MQKPVWLGRGGPPAMPDALRNGARDVARPTKEFNERRGEQLNVRVTPDERAQLDRTASGLGLSTAEFLRRRGLGYRLPPVATERQANALAATALVRLGNNLNQIAHHLNAGRPAPLRAVDELAQRIGAELDRLYGSGDHGRRPVL